MLAVLDNKPIVTLSWLRGLMTAATTIGHAARPAEMPGWPPAARAAGRRSPDVSACAAADAAPLLRVFAGFRSGRPPQSSSRGSQQARFIP